MIKEIQKLLSRGLNFSEISEKIGLHRTTISRLVKKNNLTQIKKEKNNDCVICNKNLGENKKNNTKCKTCVTRLRRLRLKIKSVEYLGGKCVKCGYYKNIAALTFHHTEPNDKDFNISSHKHSKSWFEITKELDKCVILCANCHHIEHSKYDDNKLIKYL
jgi:hypothetical protein